MNELSNSRKFSQGVANFLTHGVKNRVLLESESLEKAIELVPTGKKRELLTEANILLHEARRKLQASLEAE